MITRMAVFLRKIRRWFMRSYWELRLISLPKSGVPGHTPGLVMVQVDGLSQTQMRRAMREGHLPFLKRLMQKEKYREYAHYSGLPSATPAVQGELFYGVKSCVPAFNFCERESGQVFTMYNPAAAAEIETRLARENRGLLEGGSSYSNIFTGGAQESHFCVASAGWQGFFKALNPVNWFFLFLFHIDMLLRAAVLMVIEFCLGIYDLARGVIRGQSFLMELQFILTRVFICVLLRELVLLGAKIDIARGLPVIHVNFFGYDEQAHRRGPSSAFAHWCLRGIDHAVKELWEAARVADRREYEVWVYSDHGQEDTLPYRVKSGMRIENKISEIFGEEPIVEAASYGHRSCGCSAGRYGQQSVPPPGPAAQSGASVPRVTVLGMGPLCYIYPAAPLSAEEKKRKAAAILEKTGAPLVLIPAENRKVTAMTASGIYKLPDDAAVIMGHDHPFLNEVTEDLVQLCHHPGAGELIVSGWLNREMPTTFPMENGSHAGFGREETRGFALFPQDAPLPARAREYLRPLHIREAALRLLGRGEEGVTYEQYGVSAEPKYLRVASYNVHGCLGMDGRFSPERIARVLARHQPDAIVLQELDAGRKRSGQAHQAEIIARKLRMDFHFHPSFCLNGHYGNAVLSRYPMRRVKVGPLPGFSARRVFEPRGVLWVELDVQGTAVQLLNTHLSIWPQERLVQAAALLGPEWLDNPECRTPVILAGDFNAAPSSAVYRRMAAKLCDCQAALEFHRPSGTWLGSYGFSRIDHVFVSPEIRVRKITIPGTQLDKTASDHFPLFVDLEINSAEESAAKGSEHENIKTS